MKSQYEEEIYSFFTQPDNFETMIKVASHKDEVVKRLIKEFWDALKMRLEEWLKNEEGEWEVGYSGAFDHRYAKLWCYKKKWVELESRPVVALAFENLHVYESPFVGISPNRDSKKYKTELIKEKIMELDRLKTLSVDTSNPWWARWAYLPFSFTREEDLVKILPGNRAEQVEIALSGAQAFFDCMQNEVDTIIKNAKL